MKKLTRGSFRVKDERQCTLEGGGTGRQEALTKSPWCGVLEADGDDHDVRFMTVNVPPHGAEETETLKSYYHPHLIRFYIEHVWKLKRPDVIISVTGSARSFDLNTEARDKIMKGMMDGTRSLDAWFVTGGSRTGIMQAVGKARAKYNPKAPLIGITPLGGVCGGERLRGIDISKCESCPDANVKATRLETVKIAEKNTTESVKPSWKKLGFPDECLPALGVESEGPEYVEEFLSDEIDKIKRRIVKVNALDRAGLSKVLKPAKEFLQRKLTGAQSQLKQMQESQKEFKKFLESCSIQEEDFIKLKDDHDVTWKVDSKVRKVEDFEEVSRICQHECKKRSMYDGSFLDPNHSHFVFADDGSLQNFGIETRLRADIERHHLRKVRSIVTLNFIYSGTDFEIFFSCIAGNFRGIGVSEAGIRGKILQRLDDKISEMLIDEGKGECLHKKS